MARKIEEVDEYIPPTESGYHNAKDHGVPEQYAKLGFDIHTSCVGTVVRRLYYAYEKESARKPVPSHEACAKEAVRQGLCKIIPVKSLPKCVPPELRKYIWVDTPKNREHIKQYFAYREEME